METTRQVTIPPGLPVTAPQRDYVEGLRKRLNLPNRMLDSHCIACFGCPFAELDRADMSALIDEMKGWTTIPAQLEREAGQLDLVGFGE